MNSRVIAVSRVSAKKANCEINPHPLSLNCWWRLNRSDKTSPASTTSKGEGCPTGVAPLYHKWLRSLQDRSPLPINPDLKTLYLIKASPDSWGEGPGAACQKSPVEVSDKALAVGEITEKITSLNRRLAPCRSHFCQTNRGVRGAEPSSTSIACTPIGSPLRSDEQLKSHAVPSSARRLPSRLKAKLKSTRSLLALACMVVTLFFGGCSNESKVDNAPQKEQQRTNRIVAASYALQYLTQKLVGDEIKVEFPASDSPDPKSWSPSVKDIASMQRADLIVVNGNGAPYAQWLVHVTLPDSKICKSCEDIPLS